MSIFKKNDSAAGAKLNMDAKAAALASEEDEESKIAKLLKKMPKWRYIVLIVLTLAMTTFQLYIKLVKPLQPWAQIPLHMCFALAIVFLFNPMADKVKNKENKLRHLWWIYDAALLGCVAFICYFFLTHANALNMRVLSVDPMTTLDIVVAVMLIFCVMEAVRRTVSLALFS